MSAPALPPVTDAHRLAAFEAMRWTGWTYETAMKFDLRRRLIECRAAQMRTREWLASHPGSPATVRRARVAADGHSVTWYTQTVMGPRQAQEEPDLL